MAKETKLEPSNGAKAVCGIIMPISNIDMFGYRISDDPETKMYILEIIASEI
jgi:hypothetical protein